MNLNYSFVISAMFDMIVYVSAPYALDHPSTQDRAIVRLNKTLAGIYKREPSWACVNALYSFYNNHNIEKGSPLEKPTYTVLFGMVESLMKSSRIHIVIATPGWEYSDVVITECALAAKYKIPTVYEELV